MRLTGIFDFIIVKGWQVWNICLRRWNSGWTMLNFVGTRQSDSSFQRWVSDWLCFWATIVAQTSMIIAGHQPLSVSRKLNVMCYVCNLESQFHKSSASDNADDCQVGKGTWSIRSIVACTNKSCRPRFHFVQVNSNNYIFQMPQFDGMMCFEIAHNKSTVG